jgi:hypothetical protein
MKLLNEVVNCNQAAIDDDHSQWTGFIDSNAIYQLYDKFMFKLMADIVIEKQEMCCNATD